MPYAYNPSIWKAEAREGSLRSRLHNKTLSNKNKQAKKTNKNKRKKWTTKILDLEGGHCMHVWNYQNEISLYDNSRKGSKHTHTNKNKNRSEEPGNGIRPFFGRWGQYWGLNSGPHTY
jgi:hypothetical protein